MGQPRPCPARTLQDSPFLFSVTFAPRPLQNSRTFPTTALPGVTFSTLRPGASAGEDECPAKTRHKAQHKRRRPV
ncbi:hypothetical protein SPHINGOR109_51310 [Sphingorhabdus sp. 109]|nr:hypothetical protein SPHINGOR109_51310 [Sphingorhabdus sp. 109]